MFLSASTLTHVAWASEPRSRCFTEHLERAIRLNHDRKPVYAELTHGKSKKISNLMIVGERLALFLAHRYDREARSFQSEGIPVLCKDFVSMDLVPEFSYPAPHAESERLPAFDVGALSHQIQTQYRRAGFPGVYEVTTAELEVLKSRPHEQCLVRHVLESIARTASLGTDYQEQADRLKVRSPERLSWKFIRSQLLFLHYAGFLDRLAHPLQRQGVPIICQDVPPIEVPPLPKERYP
jgi:hypothetical protein